MFAQYDAAATAADPDDAAAAVPVMFAQYDDAAAAADPDDAAAANTL